MIKTIRGRMVIMMTLTILVLTVAIFSVFALFADDYYYSRKKSLIKEAYNTVKKTDVLNLTNDNKIISQYEDERLTFIICNSSFERVYVTKMEKKPIDAQTRIANDIVANLRSFSYDYKSADTKTRIAGYGKVLQDDEDYYIYIYENKDATKIFFTYYRWFFFVVGIFVLVAGIIISLIISRKITRPIVKIEKAASKAVNSGYSLNVETKQEFKEVDSLANSINNMLAVIRTQMSDLQDELSAQTQAEEERRVFINNVSHELKTPLAVISSQIEMINMIDDEEKRKEYIKSITEETDKMTDMINDMIVMYATKSNENEFAIEKCDIAELVCNTLGNYEELFEERNIELKQDYDEDCEAMVNTRYLSQAVSNYISNAIKHCSEPGVITTRVRNGIDTIRIEVGNDGEHVPDDVKDKIWDMFYSKDVKPRSHKLKSSGIGLSIVKSVMEVHNGDYGFDNIDGGVVFWMEFPKNLNEYTNE